ncbi:MAG: hypothetical protein AAFR64_05075 [Pseudomonadota bacterium]
MGALPSAALSQEGPEQEDQPEVQSDFEDGSQGDLPGKLSFTFLVAATQSEVVLTESEVMIPDDIIEGDIDVTLAEDVTASNTIVGVGVGYRVLPFLELNAQGGFISTSSELGLTVNGTPADTFPIQFGGPISFDGDVTTSAEGYSVGIGATGVLPIASIGDDMVLAYGSYQHIWNEFSDDGISVDVGRLSGGFVFPVNLMNEKKPIFRVGVSYINSERVLERGLTFNGEEIMVRAVQETEDPFFGEVGIAYPVSRKVLFNLGTSVQTTGKVSVVGSITFRP